MEGGMWRTALTGFLIGCLFASTAVAADAEKDDKGNEFAFNLFTDIAPILALFGEQFARQFMSESFTWLDHIIFAMVPLGIVACITGAIRVQGPHIVRAFIGRARENKALVEYELMSSTSHEVGEAFNGQGIVRVMGRPRVVEFVIFPKQYADAEEFFTRQAQEVPEVAEPDRVEMTDSEEDDSDMGGDDSFSIRSSSSDSTDLAASAISTDSLGRNDDGNSVESADNARLSEGSNMTSSEGQDSTSLHFTTSPRIDHDRGVRRSGNSLIIDFKPKTFPKKHESCGIHSLESMIRANDPDLMQFGEYHSQGYNLLQLIKAAVHRRLAWLIRFTGDKEQISFAERLWERKKKADPEAAETPSDDEKQEEEEAESHTESSDDGNPEPAPRTFDLGPPNLQLNLTPDYADHRQHHKRIAELYAVAFVAVLLQVGLVVLAAATVYYKPLRKSIPYDSQSYGFPCYAAGTALLCVGMGICSYAVERNSIEMEWTVRGAEDAESLPRLLFLQKEQSVNDQFFEPYTLLSGRKTRILGSARNPDSYSTKLVNTTWEWITVAGAVASGAGFTCQFMGLRGLTYPCSLAQLGAIVLMVILRGFIRRGLGRESAHSPMLSGYELEHLAILITYLPEFRSFDEPEKDNGGAGEAEHLKEVFGWEVVLPKSRARGLTTEITITDMDAKNTLPDHTNKAYRNPRLYVPSPSSFQAASSEQLLRVRRRLGNLCQWKSRSVEHALILTRSIEHFMDMFFPLDERGSLPPAELWEMPVAGPAGKDTVTFVVSPEEKNGKRRWCIDVGKVEAAMSLWMAFMEAKAQPSSTTQRPQRSIVTTGKNESDWLRDEDRSRRQKFYRVLGESTKMDRSRLGAVEIEDSNSEKSDSEDSDSGSDSDDSSSNDSNQSAPLLTVLERDLKWWIGDQFTLISRPTRGYSVDDPDQAQFDPWLMQGPHNLEIPELVIGFNAEFGVEDEDSEKAAHGDFDEFHKQQTDITDAPPGVIHELGVISEGFLADILTQHLFTSFIWAISKSLPEDCLKVGFQPGDPDIEIEGRDQFDHNLFDETWYLPRLSHIKLKEVVRQIESYGLGNRVDILLCMIPALSARDLLPNHAMLQLIPTVSAVNDWASIARCYYNLMTSTLDITKREKLCYSVIVHAMDFLELACQPYHKSFKPSAHLFLGIKTIVRELRQSHFVNILESIVAALHNRQHRRAVFESIIRLYGGESGEWGKLLSLYQDGGASIMCDHLKRAVGHSSGHEKILDLLERVSTFDSEMSRQELVEQDIFGWTPLHYCSATPKRKRLQADHLIWTYCRNTPFINAHHHPDRMGRTPLHIAAARGFRRALSGMTSRLTSGETQSVLGLKGQDGMTLVHLAVLSQSQKCLDFVMRNGYSLQKTNETDAWGREPMHIAAQIGNAKAVPKIVGRGLWSLSHDFIGNTPIDYLIERNNEQSVPEKQSIEEEKDVRNARNSDDLAEKTSADGEVDKGQKANQVADEDAQREHDITRQETPGIEEDSSQDSGGESSEAGETERQKPTAGNPKHEILLDLARLRPKWTDNHGKGFAHYTAEMGDLDLMSRLDMDTPVVGMDMPDDNGMTPLHHALAAGKTNTAIALLKQFGANPLAEDKDKVTPLMLAVGEALLEVVQVLLKLYTREQIDRQSARGDSAIHYIVATHSRKEINNEQRLGVLKTLKAAGFNILQPGQGQKTILHDALFFKDETVLSYILGLPRDELKDVQKDDDSFLVSACRHGFTAAVPVFLEMWPEMVDDVDSIWNRSALTWSCAGGHEAIVRILAAHSRTNLNFPFQTGYDHSPLHVATNRKSSTVLSCFFEQDPARYASSMTDNEITPLLWAIKQARVQTARLWFDHPYTPDAHKVEGLRELFIGRVRIAYKFRTTIVHLFHAIPENAIPEKDLLWLLEGARALRLWDALDAFVQRTMGSDAWTRIKFPYHVGIEAKNTKLLASAIRKHLRYEDNDGWSLQDYAASFNRADLLSDLDLSSVPAELPSAEKKPARLRWRLEGSRRYRRLSPCKAHGKTICSGVQAIRCIGASDYTRFACIPANRCVPRTSHGGYFYFEVSVRVDSPSKLLVLGFCSDRYEAGYPPGKLHHSWGFYGNTGHLIVRGAPGEENKGIDLGYLRSFGAGDVVGVGWSAVTGEALCTWNGKKLLLDDETQQTIKRTMLHTGKKYPYVGHRVSEKGRGLEFRINLGLSPDHHPFMYKGPFF